MPFDSNRSGKGSNSRLDNNMKAEVGKTTTFGRQIGHGAFTYGASFSWSDSADTATGIIHEKPAERLNDCAYWTFIPDMVM